MLSTAKSITPAAPMPQKPTVTAEQAITMLTTVLDYMRETGATIEHRTGSANDLQLRIRYADFEIVPVLAPDKTLSFRLVPVLAHAENRATA